MAPHKLFQSNREYFTVNGKVLEVNYPFISQDDLPVVKLPYSEKNFTPVVVKGSQVWPWSQYSSEVARPMAKPFLDIKLYCYPIHKELQRLSLEEITTERMEAKLKALIIVCHWKCCILQNLHDKRHDIVNRIISSDSSLEPSTCYSSTTSSVPTCIDTKEINLFLKSVVGDRCWNRFLQQLKMQQQQQQCDQNNSWYRFVKGFRFKRNHVLVEMTHYWALLNSFIHQMKHETKKSQNEHKNDELLELKVKKIVIHMDEIDINKMSSFEILMYFFSLDQITNTQLMGVDNHLKKESNSINQQEILCISEKQANTLLHARSNRDKVINRVENATDLLQEVKTECQQSKEFSRSKMSKIKASLIEKLEKQERLLLHEKGALKQADMIIDQSLKVLSDSSQLNQNMMLIKQYEMSFMVEHTMESSSLNKDCICVDLNENSLRNIQDKVLQIIGLFGWSLFRNHPLYRLSLHSIAYPLSWLFNQPNSVIDGTSSEATDEVKSLALTSPSLILQEEETGGVDDMSTVTTDSLLRQPLQRNEIRQFFAASGGGGGGVELAGAASALTALTESVGGSGVDSEYTIEVQSEERMEKSASTVLINKNLEAFQGSVPPGSVSMGIVKAHRLLQNWQQQYQKKKHNIIKRKTTIYYALASLAVPHIQRVVRSFIARRTIVNRKLRFLIGWQSTLAARIQLQAVMRGFLVRLKYSVWFAELPKLVNPCSLAQLVECCEDQSREYSQLLMRKQLVVNNDFDDDEINLKKISIVIGRGTYHSDGTRVVPHKMEGERRWDQENGIRHHSRDNENSYFYHETSDENLKKHRCDDDDEYGIQKNRQIDIDLDAIDYHGTSLQGLLTISLSKEKLLSGPRQRCCALGFLAAILTIQSFIRMSVCKLLVGRIRYFTYNQSTFQIQQCFRMFLARRRLRELLNEKNKFIEMKKMNINAKNKKQIMLDNLDVHDEIYNEITVKTKSRNVLKSSNLKTLPNTPNISQNISTTPTTKRVGHTRQESKTPYKTLNQKSSLIKKNKTSKDNIKTKEEGGIVNILSDETDEFPWRSKFNRVSLRSRGPESRLKMIAAFTRMSIRMLARDGAAVPIQKLVRGHLGRIKTLTLRVIREEARGMLDRARLRKERALATKLNAARGEQIRRQQAEKLRNNLEKKKQKTEQMLRRKEKNCSLVRETTRKANVEKHIKAQQEVAAMASNKVKRLPKTPPISKSSVQNTSSLPSLSSKTSTPRNKRKLLSSSSSSLSSPQLPSPNTHSPLSMSSFSTLVTPQSLNEVVEEDNDEDDDDEDDDNDEEEDNDDEDDDEFEVDTKTLNSFHDQRPSFDYQGADDAKMDHKQKTNYDDDNDDKKFPNVLPKPTTMQFQDPETGELLTNGTSQLWSDLYPMITPLEAKVIAKEKAEKKRIEKEKQLLIIQQEKIRKENEKLEKMARKEARKAKRLQKKLNKLPPVVSPQFALVSKQDMDKIPHVPLGLDLLQYKFRVHDYTLNKISNSKDVDHKNILHMEHYETRQMFTIVAQRDKYQSHIMSLLIKEENEEKRRRKEIKAASVNEDALTWVKKRHDRERKAARIKIERINHDNEIALVSLLNELHM